MPEEILEQQLADQSTEIPIESVPESDSVMEIELPNVPNKVTTGKINANPVRGMGDTSNMISSHENSSDGDTEGVLNEKDSKSKVKIEMPAFFSNIPFEKIMGLIANFLVPLACLAAIFFLAFAILIPSYKEIPTLDTTLSSKKALSSQLLGKVSALRELVDLEPIVEEYSNVINTALISEPKVPELLAQIDIMVKESGLGVNSLNYSEGGLASSGFTMVTVALNAEGSYENLIRLLEIIENASRIIILKDFRYSASISGGSLSISASFQLEAPYLTVAPSITDYNTVPEDPDPNNSYDSNAIDSPIDLKISSPEFLTDMKKILSLKRYDVSDSLIFPTPQPFQPEPEPIPDEAPEETPELVGVE